MTIVPVAPWEPDKGPYSGSSIDLARNVLRSSNGVVPISDLSPISDSLGSEAKGAWIYRNTSGNFGLIAATQTKLWKMESDGGWEDISKVGDYTGPGEGDLWQADMFGTLIIMVNINDQPQKYDVDSGTDASDLGGTPPKAKYIETVGDFVFLSFLKVGATEYPRKFQYSGVNDAENWTITGDVDDSDDQELPDGDEIMGIFSCPGGARIIQRRCKRRLTFNPGSDIIWQVSDIDSMRGAIAPNAVVNIGGDNYLYLNETGFYMNDSHTPIGMDRVDQTFLADINPDKLSWVQGVNDPTLRVVWLRYQDGSDVYKLIGYDWGHDQWLYCDAAVQLLVTAVSVGVTMDDLTGLMEDYEGVPMDSRIFKGGRITSGCFLEDDILYLFAGSPMEAEFETATTELTPNTGSFVSGAKGKGDATNYSIAVGKAMLMDGELDWSGANTRSMRTGRVPFRADGKYHRFRTTIPAGELWTIWHGLEPDFTPSGDA